MLKVHIVVSLAPVYQNSLNAAETVESIFLLATCYYRSGRKQQSRHLLMAETASSPECDLLYARCCLELGE